MRGAVVDLGCARLLTLAVSTLSYGDQTSRARGAPLRDSITLILRKPDKCLERLRADCTGPASQTLVEPGPARASRGGQILRKTAAPFHLRYGRSAPGPYGQTRNHPPDQVVFSPELPPLQPKPVEGGFSRRRNCGPVSPSLWPERRQPLRSTGNP
jgi:hypothetical protein